LKLWHPDGKLIARRGGQDSLMSKNFPIEQTADRLSLDDAASFRKPKPAREAAGDDTVHLARVEIVSDMLKADAERLRIDLVTIKHDLQAARDDVNKERERWLDLIANQKRLLESEACKPMLVLEQGEMALAQAVLAAQQRAKCQARESPLLKRLRALRTFHGQARPVHDTSDGRPTSKIENTDVTTETLSLNFIVLD